MGSIPDGAIWLEMTPIVVISLQRPSPMRLVVDCCVLGEGMGALAY